MQTTFERLNLIFIHRCIMEDNSIVSNWLAMAPQLDFFPIDKIDDHKIPKKKLFSDEFIYISSEKVQQLITEHPALNDLSLKYNQFILNVALIVGCWIKVIKAV